MPTPALACGYVRGSTRDQLTTLEAQAAQIERYFAGHPKGAMVLVPPPEALRAVTAARLEKVFGGKPDRAQMERILALPVFVDTDESAFKVPFYEREMAAGMIAFMQERGIRNVGFAKLDRVFRKQLDCLFTMEDLKAQKIGVHLLDLQMDTSTPIGEAMLGMLSLFAQLENRRRSERQKDVNAIRKVQGLVCGTIPYGSRRESEGSARLADDEAEAPIRDRLLPGGDLGDLSHNEAARRLRAEGLRTRCGGKWYHATVQSVREYAATKVRAAA